MDPVADLVERIRAGHAVTADDLRTLLAQGVTRSSLLDAFVGAADGAASRRFHRALAVLRDLER
jgi:hypothetical protein